MSGNTDGTTNRREILRKAGTGAAVALGGVAAAAGSASASHISPNDTIEVDPTWGNSAEVFSQCCTADLSCAGGTRCEGQRGTVMETCSAGYKDFLRVLWFESGCYEAEGSCEEAYCSSWQSSSYIDEDDVRLV